MFIPSEIPVRYTQVILLWLCLIVSLILRINISVCIVPMTNDKYSSQYEYPTYNWTEVQKSQILSSLFWGYIPLQIFIGNIIEKKGTKNILTAALVLTSVCTLITPFAAGYGYIVVVALRVLEGLAQCALIPGINVHISKWIPPSERVGLLSLCFSGSPLSPLLGFPLCGYLAASRGGWPSVFYVTGGFGFAWVILWLWIGADSPGKHRTISDIERAYIETSLRQDMKPITKPTTPWISIFTTIPVYAMIVSCIVESFGYWTLLTEMPNYLSAIFDLDIEENGLLSSLPYLCAYITSVLYSIIATYIRNHYDISKTLHRNIWNSIALWGSSSVLFVLSLMSKPNTLTAVLLLVMAVSLITAKFNGYATNPIDLSPNFCGTLAALTNTAGALGSIFGPLCVGWLVVDPTSQGEWNSVFRWCSAVMMIGNLIYVIFGSSEVQPWNDQVKKYAVVLFFEIWSTFDLNMLMTLTTHL